MCVDMVGWGWPPIPRPNSWSNGQMAKITTGGPPILRANTVAYQLFAVHTSYNAVICYWPQRPKLKTHIAISSSALPLPVLGWCDNISVIARGYLVCCDLCVMALTFAAAVRSAAAAAASLWWCGDAICVDANDTNATAAPGAVL